VEEGEQKSESLKEQNKGDLSSNKDLGTRKVAATERGGGGGGWGVVVPLWMGKKGRRKRHLCGLRKEDPRPHLENEARGNKHPPEKGKNEQMGGKYPGELLDQKKQISEKTTHPAPHE